MPRPRRLLPIGTPIHVTNRGNDRRLIFLQRADYQNFIGLLKDGLDRQAVDVYGYSAMPNHVHLVLSQREPGAISAYMHRLTCITACTLRWSTSSAGLGHVFQRRFWSRAIVGEAEFVTALRYVESNASDARLVKNAEDWEWGSLWERIHPGRRILAASPVGLPDDWIQVVNSPLSKEALENVRPSARIGRPRMRRTTLPPPSGPGRMV